MPPNPAAPTAGQRPSLRDRVSALRNIPPFLRQIWTTSKGLTLVSLGLRLVRSLLPIATLYVGKLIIDEAVRLVRLGLGFDDLATAWHSGQLSHLVALLLAEFALAIASDLLGRMVSYADGLLSELFTNATSIRLMEHAATLDLEDFEDPDLQDKLDRARRQTMGRMNLMSQLFGQVQDTITVISFAIGLLVYAPWLILLLGVALIPAFVGEAHFNSLDYTLNFQWTPERRQLEYLRQMGASVETAKEVKIFNLNRFFIARFRELSDRFYAANRLLARKRAVWGTLLAALGTLGYYVAYAYIAWRTVRGDFTIGDLTFLAGSFRRLRQLLEGLLIGFSQVAGQALYLDDLRANIGVIFQDFVRYHLTAAENIGVGQIDAMDDRARIERAARKGMADEVVASLPNGYDQVVGRRFKDGMDLSGGQWQKIAIARAYMRDAQVMILDEPTAALDARSEFEVFERFKELSSGRTAVLISHRFSSVRMADRILVLADGKVEASGTHEQLMAQGGRYAELFELQAAGYR
jgi:ABC-type multidrug transport system fused ATPase/permease subunit